MAHLAAWLTAQSDTYGGGCSESEIDTIISQIDTNEDGLVDYKEFCEMMLRRECVSFQCLR